MVTRVTDTSDTADRVSEAVPYGLRVTAALSWRFLVLAGALYILGYVFSALRSVFIPVAIALLLAALMGPLVSRLTKLGVPRGAASAITMITGLAVVGGVLTFVVNAFNSGLPELSKQLQNSINTIQGWLQGPPFNLKQADYAQALHKLIDKIKENQETITSGALATASTVGELLTGLGLVLFTLIFFLYDGPGIWKFLMRLVPERVRERTDTAGQRGFASLVAYVRATALVAVVDGVGIGIGLGILGVPLAVPLATLVFLGAFIPIIGSLLSGLIAVLIALVAKGWVTALLTLAVVVAIQQLEGHVLQPLLMGRAVALHALAVVLAIAVGLVLGGVVGALLSVPLVAVLNSAIRSFFQEPEPKAPLAKDVELDEEAEPAEKK
ncbi:AI-2E family transporter [Pseudonocardiaceae bacterium YIM PH 21723]|nr:AI-2E family transporter [Pseudonocardiaceae bacterium YIM PH 21723]